MFVAFYFQHHTPINILLRVDVDSAILGNLGYPLIGSTANFYLHTFRFHFSDGL